jgi:hypothetical protein
VPQLDLTAALRRAGHGPAGAAASELVDVYRDVDDASATL